MIGKKITKPSLEANPSFFVINLKNSWWKRLQQRL